MQHIHILIDGLLIGSLLCNLAGIIYIKRTCGTLRIDHSNPEKDIYRFDIDSIDSLSRRKRIVLKVDNHADLSHE